IRGHRGARIKVRRAVIMQIDILARGMAVMVPDMHFGIGGEARCGNRQRHRRPDPKPQFHRQSPCSINRRPSAEAASLNPWSNVSQAAPKSNKERPKAAHLKVVSPSSV